MASADSRPPAHRSDSVHRRRVSCLALALSLSVPSLPAIPAGEEPPPGTHGSFVSFRSDADAYLQPLAGLPRQSLQAFNRGRHHFDKKWASVTSLQFEWGLGPTYIAKSCGECHGRAGRGRPPASPDEQLLSMLVRISVPGNGEHGEPLAHPAYGDQLQNGALRGPFPDFAYHTAPVPPEADLYVEWQEHVVTLAGGEQVPLRRPLLRAVNLAFGEFGPDAMLSLRIAQPVFGLGLLQAVPDAALLEHMGLQRSLGMNGRVNRVWDAVNARGAIGRFGWKANQPSIRQQIAAAALGDMGLTSPLYRAQNCPHVQTLCAAQTPGNDPELVTTDWDELEFWTLALAVLARRGTSDPRVQRGEILFGEAGCSLCHTPQMKTAPEFPPLPALAGQTFHPYTDLLLHDMGEGLADGRPDFEAGGRDWRTPPLWGIGLTGTVNGNQAFLHDGRARNITEAILWHGGEATKSRNAFSSMPSSDRQALLKFLDSL